MRKRIVSLLLCFFLVAVQIPNGSAAEMGTYAMPQNPGITPHWNYISNVNPSLTADDGAAKVSCSVYGKIGTTTRVEITAELQQYITGCWMTVKIFTAESDSHRVMLSEVYSLTPGYSYRLRATVTAYSGTAMESDVVFSGTVVCRK